jgi:hypothetical protein
MFVIDNKADQIRWFLLCIRCRPSATTWARSSGTQELTWVSHMTCDCSVSTCLVWRTASAFWATKHTSAITASSHLTKLDDVLWASLDARWRTTPSTAGTVLQSSTALLFSKGQSSDYILLCFITKRDENLLSQAVFCCALMQVSISSCSRLGIGSV